MKFPALKKLLGNNGRFKPDDPDYRHVYLLNTILLLFIGVTVLCTILNAVQGQYIIAAIHTASAIMYFLTLLFFHKTDRLRFCSHAVVGIMLVMMAAIFANAGDINYIFVWVCVGPPVVFFLLGRKKGFLVSLIILICIAVFALLNYRSWTPSVFGVASVFNILCALIIPTLLISYFELSRYEAVQDVRKKIDELEKANSALSMSREELRLILDSTAEAIFGVDMENRCTFCNASCLENLGLGSEEEMLGKDIHELVHGRHRDGSPLPRSECSIIRTCMEGIAVHMDDEVFWRPGGVSFDVEYNSYPQYKDGTVVGAVVTFTDNTLKRMHEQQIEYFSSHDALTGLYNRSYFETMRQSMDTKGNLPISIILGDLNGLKLMNDIFGHDAGDELLLKTADILKSACGAEDMIVRLGGDEFVIMLPKTSQTDAGAVMDRILINLEHACVNTILCSMSLGCDTKLNTAQNLDFTLKNAENEMYKEKMLSRSKVSTDMINAVIMKLYQKNPHEELHSANVSELCKAIGEALGLSETEIVQLRSAGFLHDIGKISIDSGLYNKKEPYTAVEEQEYRQHPAIGFRILNLFDHTLSLADSVYSHHERWDGSGFPRALKGTEIPLMARIIAVAGRYDTVTSGWHGRTLSRSEALIQLKKEAGTRLDPQIVNLFVHMMEKEEHK